MKKKAKVVMLPTKKSRIAFYNRTKSRLALATGLSVDIYYTNDNYEAQHLYITSDDEKKVNDWVIYPPDNELKKANLDNTVNPNWKKITATTDTSLGVPIGKDYEGMYKMLPLIPESFINKFVEEYNKGNVIEDVLVEYETIHADRAPNGFETLIKLNPKDNTIYITTAKDSWSREEETITKEEAEQRLKGLTGSNYKIK